MALQRAELPWGHMLEEAAAAKSDSPRLSRKIAAFVELVILLAGRLAASYSSRLIPPLTTWATGPVIFGQQALDGIQLLFITLRQAVASNTAALPTGPRG